MRFRRLEIDAAKNSLAAEMDRGILHSRKAVEEHDP